MGPQPTFQVTINPILEDTFLLFISFSLVTQVAYIGFHLPYLIVWFERLLFYINITTTTTFTNTKNNTTELMYTMTDNIEQKMPSLMDLIISLVIQ